MTVTNAPAWFTRALDALRAGDVATYVEIYDDNAVHEFPFAPEGRPQRLEGKAAISAYMAKLPAMGRFESFEAQVREAGDELIVEATSRGKRPDGQPFHRQYVWFITHENGRVSRFRDYMNPLLLRGS